MNEQKSEIRPLNGLRGIAALSVALGHFHISNLLPVLSIFYWKNAAVDLFFCLSGFTMCLAYRAGASTRLPFRNYVVARIARIYPLYLLTLVIVSFVTSPPPIVTDNDYQVMFWDYVRQMTMTNAWSFISSGTHWNFPAWSVSVEFFCYLFVFPALFYMSSLMSRYGWRVRVILSTAFMAGSYYVFMNYYNQFIIMYGRNPRVAIPEIAFSVNLIRGILGFAAGWVVYASFLSRDRLWRWASRYADIVALGVVALLIAGVSGLLPVQLMILGFPLLILGVSSGPSLTGRFLAWGPVHYLGSISYSVYLLHIPWYYFGHLRAGLFDEAPTLHLSSSIVLVGGLIGVASLSYHMVEMPLRRVIRAAWQARGQSAPRATARRNWVARWAVVAMVVILAGVEAQRVGVFHPVPGLEVAVGDEITQFPTFERAAGGGWSNREDWGIWSIGKESTLTFSIPKGAPTRLRLHIKGSFFLRERHPTVVARITVNDIDIGIFTPTLANNTIDESLALPAAALSPSAGPLRIKLWVDSPASPKSLGLSEDTRALGFGLKSLKLVDEESS